MKITNFSFVNYTTLAGFAVTLTGSQIEELYYSKGYHYNFIAQYGFIIAKNFNKISIIDAYFEKGYNIEKSLFNFDSSNKVIMDNITFFNLNNTSLIENTFINFANFDTTETTISNIIVSKCYINSGMIMQSEFPLDKLAIFNGYFSDIFLEANANLILIDYIKSIDFLNLTIKNIYWDDPNDQDSKLISIPHLNLEGDLNSTIKDVIFSNSTISFMDVNNIANNPTISYYFNVINLTLTDLTNSIPKNLIQFHEFSFHINLVFTFQNSKFTNIHFDYNGRLFLLKQRLLTPVIISNSTFENLTSAIINLDPFEVHDDSIVAIINLEDCTFNNINSAFDSFIVGHEVGYIYIDRWSFTNMYSYESGAIFYGKLDEVHVFAKNSIFKNNTAVQGSIFIFEEFAEVIITNWTFENNFALQSGIGDVRSSSVLEFINCTIKNNFAIANPISVIYEGYSILTFNNCLISNNIALTKEQVLAEFNKQWSKLWFVPSLFKNYVNSNLGVLSFSFSEVALNPVYSSLKIVNKTIINDQHSLISSILSEIVIEDSIISNITIIGEPSISLIFSSLLIDNVKISDINSTNGFDFIESIEDSKIEIDKLAFEDSYSSFINTISTEVSIKDTIFKKISSNKPILSIYSSSKNILDEIGIEDCSSISNWIISIINWENTEIVDLNVSEIANNTVIYIKNSKTIEIEEISFINCNQAFIFENSVVKTFKDSLISSNGNSNILFGGAIRSINSDISISNWTFINNKAQSGGAISFEWNSLSNCNLSLERILFDSNIAISQGGAIYYNYKRPQFNQNTFTNNQAIYGKDIASYAVKVKFNDSDSDQMSITNIASGIKYATNITFKLLDYDNQTMVLNNINQVELSSSNPSQIKLKGTNTGLLKNGVAVFSNFIAISDPGKANVLISVKWKAIDNNKIKTIFGSEQGSDTIVANFRYWKPGEMHMVDNTCNQWAAGTYSFLWNSTSCNQWITNTACKGEYKISVDYGYWRNTKNSTYIAEWLYKDACKGGFSDDNEHPVNCSEGYSGILWNDCQILNGVKYERVSDYQCEKWPNPIYNGIRVIGLLLLVFIFLMVLIIINIRKTKESEMSILIRIMTNYLQLLTTSMSFNVQYPSVLLDAFSPVHHVGSSSQAFLSFDCFITDTQLHGPFPSNAFFKIFLTGVLPILLILVISFIWIWIRLIKQSLVKNLTRNIIISFISVVFFFTSKTCSKFSKHIWVCQNWWWYL